MVLVRWLVLVWLLFFFSLNIFFGAFIVVTVTVFNSSVFHFAGPVNGDIYFWQGAIMGPPGSPYAGGLFIVLLNFSPKDPFGPPKV